jgi:hypothetical protein
VRDSEKRQIHNTFLRVSILFALLVLAACSPPNKGAKAPSKPATPPVRETTFAGYTHSTGLKLLGRSAGTILLFLDTAGTPAAESETPDGLLDSVAANASDLRAGLDVAIELLTNVLVSVGDKPVKGMTYIVSYPLDSVKLPPNPKFKEKLVRAKPGKLTHLAQVIEVNGDEGERQSWTGSPYQDFAMEGVVRWWGNTGLKSTPDGTITHVLLRGKPKQEK